MLRGSCQYDITRQINDINRSAAAQEQALINSLNSEHAGANMDMLRYYNDMDYNYDVLAADNYNKAEDRTERAREHDNEMDMRGKELEVDKWFKEQSIEIEKERLKIDDKYKAALIKEIENNNDLTETEKHLMIAQIEFYAADTAYRKSITK